MSDLKEIAVKRIYFVENSKVPFMELVDGTIRRPYYIGGPTGDRLMWLTESEVADMTSRIEKQKQDAKEAARRPKLIKLNGGGNV